MDKLTADLRAGLDPAQLLRGWNLDPETWQDELLRLRPKRALLCCCRQAGKSTAGAAAACHEAVYNPGSLSLLLAPSLRQSAEPLHAVRGLLAVAPLPVELKSDSATAIEFENGSRIIALPDSEHTIRGYSKVALLIIDEAARVSDAGYTAALPMLAVSEGRLLALSTPNGQRGWFHHEWASGEGWHRTTLTAAECPRISTEFLAEQRMRMTAAAYASEYECEFTDAIDAVFFYADVQAAIDPDLTPLFKGGW